MSEVRLDPVTGHRVIIAPNRAQRPQQFHAVAQTETAAPCPFCEGSEASTPDEILARRSSESAPNQAGWRVRVVSNKYPALQRTGVESAGATPSVYSSEAAVGTHEVIIESSEHLLRTVQLTDRHFQEVLLVYRDRMHSLRNEEQFRHAVVFKNVGPSAGATMQHLHSQIVALPFVPRHVRHETDGATTFHGRDHQCAYCAIVQYEQAVASRIVMDSDRFLVFCPFAARCPYETWIIPKSHQSRYDMIRDDEAGELAELLRSLLQRIDNILDEPAYNYYVQSAPFGDAHDSYCHWYVAVFPRITTLAGFEWSTGCFINPVAPEEAADRLKNTP